MMDLTTRKATLKVISPLTAELRTGRNGKGGSKKATANAVLNSGAVVGF